MTDLTTVLGGDYEHWFNGLAYGGDHDVAVTALRGLRGHQVRVTDRNRDRGHGSARGPSWTVARDIRQTLEVIGSAAECETQLGVIYEAFAPQVTGLSPLVSRLPDAAVPYDIVHYVYPVEAPYEVTASRERARAVEVTLRAPDPRIYSAEVFTQGIPLYVGGGASGFNAPIVNAPVNMTAVTIQTAAVANLGRDDAYPVIYARVDSGTATSVTVTNVTTGESVTVATSMAAGALLTFDSGAANGVNDERIVDLAGVNKIASWAAPYTGIRLQRGSNVLQATAVGATAVSVWVVYQHTSLS